MNMNPANVICAACFLVLSLACASVTAYGLEYYDVAAPTPSPGMMTGAGSTLTGPVIAVGFLVVSCGFYAILH